VLEDGDVRPFWEAGFQNAAYVAEIERVARVQERYLLLATQAVPIGSIASDDNGEAGTAVVFMVDLQPTLQYMMRWKNGALEHCV
jgi:hypothetical protein